MQRCTIATQPSWLGCYSDCGHYLARLSCNVVILMYLDWYWADTNTARNADVMVRTTRLILG
jgi:hypothetical protein